LDLPALLLADSAYETFHPWMCTPFSGTSVSRVNQSDPDLKNLNQSHSQTFILELEKQVKTAEESQRCPNCYPDTSQRKPDRRQQDPDRGEQGVLRVAKKVQGGS
jgi:hypothetical protein